MVKESKLEKKLSRWVVSIGLVYLTALGFAACSRNEVQNTAQNVNDGASASEVSPQ